MKVKVTLAGITDHRRTLEWPEGWPIPREGDAVTLLDDEHDPLAVRTVVWYPEGDESGDEPFVYLVVGRPRPAYY